jgi:hypothetical protein
VDDRPINPFRFGALALDEAFANREAELAEIQADALAGQDVVILAPRRFGKSSLIWRASQNLIKRRVLVAHVDLMTTPTLDRFAEKLAETLHEDLASRLFRARERLRVFQGLRVSPAVIVNPEDGSVSFSFSATASPTDLAATTERLLELPGQIAGERERTVVLVLDEFQEVLNIDPGLPRLMRSAFQRQPEVAHVYLGSRRHTMERIFNDEHEPFWRSAKRIELEVIDPRRFQCFITQRFEATDLQIEDGALAFVLGVTKGHPYATQELCYFLWQRASTAGAATEDDARAALADVLRSEDSHFTVIWDRATAHQRVLLQSLAREPGHPLASDYRRRHGLPSAASVQRALGSLEQSELAARDRGRAWLREPLLAEWLLWKIA